ncbi:class I SAM-dependent methyltransferase [bacterium]|nr:class I SAM-dependent methyltransferase [candidate division CSSED10-310 bacterium]
MRDIVSRITDPEPWSEGENIPWQDESFSPRMLKIHLSQKSDAASRRKSVIQRQVDWIHRAILTSKSSLILDLGCGPGLYLTQLAKLGHRCVGIDYSPAAVQFAQNQAACLDLPCAYLQGDIRLASFGNGYDLVMIIFGEFNVFRPADAMMILNKAFAAMKSGGMFLAEVMRYEALEIIGKSDPTWYSAASGVFSDNAYICLEETLWNKKSHTTTIRYFVIDAESSDVTRYAQSYQAYTVDQYEEMLSQCGFNEVNYYESLGDVSNEYSDEMFVIAALK